MNICQNIILIIIISGSALHAECENSSLADYNEDNILDILDMVVLVEQIMNENQYIENNDINSDGAVDIIDLVKLIIKILNPYPDISEITYLDYSANTISIDWEENFSPLFKEYQLIMSIDFENQIVIDVISSSNTVNSEISALSLYQGAWFWINVVDDWDCGVLSDIGIIENIEKEYHLDDTGHIISTEFLVEDFSAVQICASCHPGHVADWDYSSHAQSMHSPLFFSLWNEEQENHTDTGERFCVQCHNPISFVTGLDLSGNESLEALESSNLPDQVKHGISCSVCHTYTALSPSYFAEGDLSASAEYHMYPGENVFFGPIENPSFNPHHESQYSPMYSRSEMCLPCHDMTIRGVEAEITFTEWNRIPGFAMSGGTPCQECHMPLKTDGTHDHSFIGVDVDLTYPVGESPNYLAVEELLNTSASISFGAPGYELPEQINIGDTLTIPLTVESLTAHNMPSGTGFNREAWIEIIIFQGTDTLYTSGLISSNTEELDRLDPSLLLFTSYLLDENGDTTYTVSETYDIINETLPALGFRYHLYSINMPNDVSGVIDIDISFKFRPFRPMVIESNIPEFLSNLPIFEIGSIHEQVEVIE